jgi:hypothetical protein
MNSIDLIVTVCAVLSPATCEETHLVFSGGGSLQQCVMGAPPYIARWVGEHPKWSAANIPIAMPRQTRPGQRLRADRDPRTRRDKGYCLQSFKSLSVIENTASRLISMSRARHCFESR